MSNNMPRAAEECHEPSWKCQGISHCLESGHPDYNGAQMYEQFSKVGQLYLAWFRSLSSEHLCIFGLLVWYILKKILVTFFTLAFSELGVVYWTLTWLTDHCPSVP